jgi:Domain of unknown function (DUF6457)
MADADPQLTRQEWIAAFAHRAGVGEPTAQEADALLKLAGIAAHSSERTAAPLACWVAGRSGRSLQELLAEAAQVAPK